MNPTLRLPGCKHTENVMQDAVVPRCGVDGSKLLISCGGDLIKVEKVHAGA